MSLCNEIPMFLWSLLHIKMKDLPLDNFGIMILSLSLSEGTFAKGPVNFVYKSLSLLSKRSSCFTYSLESCFITGSLTHVLGKLIGRYEVIKCLAIKKEGLIKYVENITSTSLLTSSS